MAGCDSDPTALLLALDLYRANGSVILQAPPPDGYYPTTPALQYMQQVSDPAARMSSEGLLPGDGNAGMLYRIRDVTGNGPLYQAALDAFVEKVPELRWMQLLNVQHLLTQRSIEHGAFQPVLQDGDQHLHEVHAGGKPAWISHAYVVAPSQEEAVNLTGRLAQDPMEQVVLEQVPDPAPEASSGEEEVRLVGFSPRWVAVEATLNAPGVLALSEVQYPGWVARVNGQPVASLRAYGLLRAVSLPAGHSRVEWRFEPLVPLLGLFLSVLALLFVGSLVLWQIGVLRRRGGALSVRLALSFRVRSRPAGADPRRHTR